MAKQDYYDTLGVGRDASAEQLKKEQDKVTKKAGDLVAKRDDKNDGKDAEGTGAWDENGPVCTGFKALKDALPDMLLVADVCLCEYTDHGHCGPLERDARGHVAVANDRTLPLLSRAAVAYASSNSNSDVQRLAAMAKLFASETSKRAADQAVQIHGGSGYIWESEINRLFRSIKLLEIGAGTTEVRKLIIAGELLKDGL